METDRNVWKQVKQAKLAKLKNMKNIRQSIFLFFFCHYNINKGIFFTLPFLLVSTYFDLFLTC